MKKSNIIGNVSSIETSGFIDGPGVRVVVFLQGCPFRCLYCHNPETWNKTEKKTQMKPQEVLQRVLRYKEYFGKDGGVTFSGGEPLAQQEFLLECLKLCKENGINTALDTAGGEKVTTDILDYVDLVILDVKAVDKKDFEYITGANQQIFLDFLSLCQAKKKPLWLKQVVVPNINDTEESVLKLKNFAKKLKLVKKIELLGYHDMAKGKYEKLGIRYRLQDTSNMDKKRLEELQNLLN